MAENVIKNNVNSQTYKDFTNQYVDDRIVHTHAKDGKVFFSGTLPPPNRLNVSSSVNGEIGITFMLRKHKLVTELLERWESPRSGQGNGR